MFYTKAEKKRLNALLFDMQLELASLSNMVAALRPKPRAKPTPLSLAAQDKAAYNARKRKEAAARRAKSRK